MLELKSKDYNGVQKIETRRERHTTKLTKHSSTIEEKKMKKNFKAQNRVLNGPKRAKHQEFRMVEYKFSSNLLSIN